MDHEIQERILDTLRDIRSGQRDILAALQAQQTLAEQQLARSRASVEESLALQRLALARQRRVTLVAVAGILACIGAIGWILFFFMFRTESEIDPGTSGEHCERGDIPPNPHRTEARPRPRTRTPHAARARRAAI